MLQIQWSEKAVRDLRFWNKANPKIIERIYALIEDVKISPFIGIGKPEPLKHKFSGFWSRRIDKEHRLVYRIEEDAILIVSCKDHY